MIHNAKVCATLFSAIVFLSCQNPETRGTKREVVSIPDLGIRYTAPAGMVDKTSAESRQARDHVSSYSQRAAMLLLDMSSQDADASPDWHQIWLFIFPRSGLRNLNDSSAESKMSAALAGPHASTVGQPQGETIAGHAFLVSEFQVSEPPLLKHAKIYTTICKMQLVSFALVSNSASQVEVMEDSLKTLEFSPR